MPVILRIESGPRAGASVVVRPGQSIRVGRTEQADWALPEDTFLSRVHFEVQSDGKSCRLRDLKSSNGTQCNGAPVGEAELKDGDQIYAGRTRFSIQIAAEHRAPEAEKTEVPVASPPASVAASVAAQDPAQDTKQQDRERLLTTLRGSLQPLYAVLDTAVEPNVLKALLESKVEYAWLFSGQEACQLVHFAPYLVPLPPHSPLLPALVEQGWGKNWGIYFTSDRSPAELTTFLRRFMVAQLPDGTNALLRFYDPRILRALLPVCTHEQLGQLFSLLRFFMVEAEDPASATGFSVSERGYQMQEASLSGLTPPKASFIGAKTQAPEFGPPPVHIPFPGLLSLKQEQQAELAKVKRNSFEIALVEHIRETYPEQFAAAGPEEMAALVHYGATRPQRYGIRAQADIRRFVILMVQLGRDFDTQLPWAASILGKRRKPVEKLAILEATARRHLATKV